MLQLQYSIDENCEEDQYLRSKNNRDNKLIKTT
jgi:hypothetical protein